MKMADNKHQFPHIDLSASCNIICGGLKNAIIISVSLILAQWHGIPFLQVFQQWIFPQFLFRFETSSVHFTSRKSDISQETMDDLGSKLINYLTASVKKRFRCTLKGVNQ